MESTSRSKELVGRVLVGQYLHPFPVTGKKSATFRVTSDGVVRHAVNGWLWRYLFANRAFVMHKIILKTDSTARLPQAECQAPLIGRFLRAGWPYTGVAPHFGHSTYPLLSIT